ncbi:hypothetical protein GCM10010123_20420 [Pilimelia anulata]|uniref:Phytanoyl-CoA dioxygenase n=1 Tax=Pilimelia anulata TaxID=53371 RepID=A0A8J3B3F0_9ACTN|nr:phytanoyl-CoA dioxygenase family protein [Pilimelia anulata]GGJ90509.1 hypothetical protein GCM10010123_20420 [Pilimelia anulata]
MTLTATQLDAFAQTGALTVRGAVPPSLTSPAIGLITDWYCNDLQPDQIAEYTHRTFAAHLGDHQALLALFHDSGAVDLATELLGDIAPVTTAQIQVRIPAAAAPHQPVKAMHVDGVACPHLDPAELRTFSLLVGVLLSDITDPDGGAMHYQPSGHRLMAAWFRNEWNRGVTAQTPPHIDTQRGTPLLGHVGDLHLQHHLVPHAVGTNTTDTPRLMAYFRVSHPDHAERRLDALRDPWLDYPPITARAGARPPRRTPS